MVKGKSVIISNSVHSKVWQLRFLKRILPKPWTLLAAWGLQQAMSFRPYLPLQWSSFRTLVQFQGQSTRLNLCSSHLSFLLLFAAAQFLGLYACAGRRKGSSFSTGSAEAWETHTEGCWKRALDSTVSTASPCHLFKVHLKAVGLIILLTREQISTAPWNSEGGGTHQHSIETWPENEMESEREFWTETHSDTLGSSTYSASLAGKNHSSETRFLPREMEHMRKLKISGEQSTAMIVKRKPWFRMQARPHPLLRTGREHAQGDGLQWRSAS